MSPGGGHQFGYRRRGRIPHSLGVTAAAVSLLLTACHWRTAERPEEIYRQAYAQLQRGNFSSAEKLLTSGLRRANDEKSPAWAAAFQTLEAEILVRKNKFDAARGVLAQISTSELAPEFAVRAKMATALSICGVAKQPDEFEAAQHALDEAQQIASAAGLHDFYPEVEWRRGSCFIDQEDLARADRSFRRVLAMTRESKPGYAQASAVGNLVYLRIREERWDEAADYAQQFREVSQALGDRVLVEKSLGNLGVCYTRLGDYDRAELLLKKAEQMAIETQNTPDLQLTLQNLGNLSYYRGDFAGARSYYERSLPVAQRLDRPRPIAQLLKNLADVSLEAGDLDAAERYNNQALALKLKAKDPVAILRSRWTSAEIARKRRDWTAAEAGFRNVISDPSATDQIRWESHAGIARLNAARHRLDAADAEFRAAGRLIQSSRDSLKNQESRFAYFTTLTRFYSDYIDFLVENKRRDEALAVVDRSRAQMLRESIVSGNPNFRATAAKKDALLLSYWTSGDHAYAWAVTRRQAAFLPLPPPAEIAKRVEEHQRAIMRPRDLLREAGGEPAELYNLLVGPAAALIPANGRVFIVADGPLHRLNFETLVVSKPVPHYWIEDVTISMAPSLELLGEAAPERPGHREPVLLIGDPVPPSAEFPKLPNAGREIDQIQQLFPVAEREVFEGDQAEPAVFRNVHPERFALIHFAAHATANSESPLDSAVVLSRKDGDFKLYAHDVMNIPLSAELVTISACRSAGARTYEGEGLVGFAWAFLHAGARSVVAGLWNVEDGSTAQMMEHMYRELRLGRTAAGALRTAKLGLLHSGTAYRKPFYWAPFLLYSGSAPHQPTR